MSTYLEQSVVFKCYLINICSVLLCACNVLIREIASFVSHFPALEARAFSRLSLTRSLACVYMYAYPSEYYLHPLARCGTSDDDGMGALSHWLHALRRSCHACTQSSLRSFQTLARVNQFASGNCTRSKALPARLLCAADNFTAHNIFIDYHFYDDGFDRRSQENIQHISYNVIFRNSKSSQISKIYLILYPLDFN